MEDRVDLWLLWPRALCVGLVAFLMGVAGHVSADGLLPGPWMLGFLFVATVLLAGPMLARPASRLRLVCMLMGGQAVIHLALTATAGHRGDPAGSAAAVGPASPRPLPVVDGRRVGSLQDAYESATRHADSATPALPIGHLIADMQAHASMMVAHLAAAALIGVWLAYGERCLWTVVALTGRRVVAARWALAPAPAAPAAGPSMPVEGDRAVTITRWCQVVRPVRGPPAVLA